MPSLQHNVTIPFAYHKAWPFVNLVNSEILSLHVNLLLISFSPFFFDLITPCGVHGHIQLMEGKYYATRHNEIVIPSKCFLHCFLFSSFFFNESFV